MASDPEHFCAAFDYDQTLHLREKLRGDSRDMLERLRSMGVPFCIVTAAQPRVGSVKALSQELQVFQMGHLFHTTPLDPQKALGLVRSWGPTASLSWDRLRTKTLLLFALLTDRRPSDLCRIGYSTVRFAELQEEEGAEQSTKKKTVAYYRLQRGPSDWSAEQILLPAKKEGEEEEEEDLVCPVSCLKHYIEQLKQRRPVPTYRVIDPEVDMPELIQADDVLFLREENGAKFTAEELELALADILLRECRYPAWQVEGFTREPAQEMSVQGIQMARLGSLIAAKYNKAEACALFCQQQQKQGGDGFQHRLVFVDDNIDNVFSVYSYFANRELQSSSGGGGGGSHPILCTSVWYEPPLDGKAESFDEKQSKFAHSIMRPLLDRPNDEKQHDHSMRSRKVILSFPNVGSVELTQVGPLNAIMSHIIQLNDSSLQIEKIVIVNNDDISLPWNPSKKPLDPEERPGCLGIEIGIPNFAYTLFGKLSIVGKTAVLVTKSNKTLASITITI